jgi:hypothetical protein
MQRGIHGGAWGGAAAPGGESVGDGGVWAVVGLAGRIIMTKSRKRRRAVSMTWFSPDLNRRR